MAHTVHVVLAMIIAAVLSAVFATSAHGATPELPAQSRALAADPRTLVPADFELVELAEADFNEDGERDVALLVVPTCVELEDESRSSCRAEGRQLIVNLRRSTNYSTSMQESRWTVRRDGEGSTDRVMVRRTTVPRKPLQKLRDDPPSF